MGVSKNTPLSLNNQRTDICVLWLPAPCAHSGGGAKADAAALPGTAANCRYANVRINRAKFAL